MVDKKKVGNLLVTTPVTRSSQPNLAYSKLTKPYKNLLPNKFRP